MVSSSPSTMLTAVKSLLLAVFVISAHVEASSPRSLGAQGVNLRLLEQAQSARSQSAKFGGLVVQDSNQIPEKDFDFRAEYFRQPLDHFSKDSRRSWHQRFWVNSRHYKPGGGGPVIVLDGGETSGEDRLPFLDTGIVDILARATGGLGVVLEHRYYGQSIPVSNFSTDALRFLDNEQSAADSANFMANVEFNDIDEDLTAPGTPWIYYGGSYAGARAAHMKVLYPELVFGAIASSGVTHATLENWQYLDIIRQAAEPKCSAHLVSSIQTIDGILSTGYFKRQLKGVFGLADLEHDEDFASLIANPVFAWQSKNWDPEVGSTKFDEFCVALSSTFGKISAAATELPFGHPDRLVTVEDNFALDFSIINYGKYIKANYVSRCPEGVSVEECFGTFDETKYQNIGLDQEWRLWQFQVCTQWGYFTTAPPDQKHPRIVSKLLTLGYDSKICQLAYPAGEHFRVPTMPNITAVNALGDFDIAADRLAIIDGEVDPWRSNTPHSADASDREDTILQPFKLIPNGVHHYDEYGLKNLLDEPPEIRKIHGEMITFVLEWLKDWESLKNN